MICNVFFERYVLISRSKFESEKSDLIRNLEVIFGPFGKVQHLTDSLPHYVEKNYA